ncbi:MAG: Brp/Blh family beta-carotene 15,15'-dioxygenase [Bacteroidota bacterium]|nr:Brp/Blh family beta-carotene 15,15'-dioxygenase [Bacteroidota bacterium]
MSKIIIFRIAVATFFIILSCLFSVNYQDMVGFSLILSVGLIHGANDLLIIKRNTSSDTNFSQFKSFIKYFGIVLAGLIFFYFFPSFALISFILVSIYHFGEQHIEAIPLDKNLKNSRRYISIISHGILLFTIIFMNNTKVVVDVFSSFNIVFLNYNFLIIILIITSILYASILIIKKDLQPFLISEILFFGLFYFLSITSSLILCFSVYFIFFHSILSIKDQVKYIYGSNNSKSLKRYIKNSLPYFILALIFLILFYIYTEIDNNDLLPIIFTFLAAITFPHVLVIEKMYRTMKQ